MASVYFASANEAHLRYPNIAVENPKNPKKEIFEDRDYVLYGRATINTGLGLKVSHIFKIVLSSLLVVVSFGTVLIIKPFRVNYLELINNLNKFDKKINVFVLAQLQKNNEKIKEIQIPEPEKQIDLGVAQPEPEEFFGILKPRMLSMQKWPRSI